jgi:membrane-bound ClpP family serine protease
MEDWMPIILLILVGLILIYLELIFVPGTTIFGVLGVIFTGIGIYITYDVFGSKTGSLVLAGSFAISIIALVYSFKSGVWNKFALKTKNKGKFNEDYTLDLKEEMTGTSLSDLKPIGNAEFGEKSYEVTTNGNHIGTGEPVKISSILGNKIIVESINK